MQRRAWISQLSNIICIRRTGLTPVKTRESLLGCQCLAQSISTTPSSSRAPLFMSSAAHFGYDILRKCRKDKIHSRLFHISTLVGCSPMQHHNIPLERRYSRDGSSVYVELKTDEDVVRFHLGDMSGKEELLAKRKKNARTNEMSRKAKLNELRFYRLKAKKKMNSPNPEVRIRYKLEKAKRKEAWLIEKLRKYEMPKAPPETYDPEILTEEDKFYLKRTGEKKKNFVLVGRRGVFGGVVLNMHLHWKNHETVKVICKPCKPGQVHQYAEELARLSKGIVIDIKPNNTIIFYRGKNYVRPDVMSPPDTLSKAKALEKYKYEQSLEHTSQFIEKLENELQEYHDHLARYKKERDQI